MSTPVTQTILHSDPRRPGNCFAAAVASALGRRLEEVPHFVEWGQWLHNEQLKVADFDSDDADRKCWWAMFLGYVAGCGFWPITLASLDEAQPDELVFVSGPSPRGVPHQVLYRNGQPWHDPHPSRAGILSVHEGDGAIFVLRPAPPQRPQPHGRLVSAPHPARGPPDARDHHPCCPV